MNFSSYCLLFVIVCALYTRVQCGCYEKRKQVLLDEHNKYRKKLLDCEAEGQPKPKSMPMLQWDTELEKTAQKWALNCTLEHDDAAHRIPKGYNYVGQTIYAGRLYHRAVSQWFYEYLFYNFTSNTCSLECGHYKQVVWDRTTHVGCGMKNCSWKPSFGYEIVVVCNYYPGGAARSLRPYEVSLNSTC